MNVQRLARVCVPAFLIVAHCAAQDIVELKPAAIVKVAGQKADGIVEPVKCDSRSNIYAQASRESDAPGQTPVIKLSPEGKVTVFPRPRREGKALGILGFAPTVDEGVVMLTTDWEDHRYVETYDDRGEFKSRFSLPAEVDPAQIAAASDGKVLVSGSYSSPGPEGAGVAKPFVGIFGSDGRLEREVDLTETPPRRVRGGSSKLEPDASRDVREIRPSLSSSTIQSSPDGNFIFSRISNGGPVYIVSPAGFELNKVDLPSLPDSQLLSVTVDANRVAALYAKKKAGTTQNEISDVFIPLLDSQTGEEMIRFHHSSPQLGAGLACYHEGVFSFLLTGQGDELEIVRAKGE